MSHMATSVRLALWVAVVVRLDPRCPGNDLQMF